MRTKIQQTFDALGLELGGTASGTHVTHSPSGPRLESIDPSTEEILGAVQQAGADDYQTCVSRAVDAFRDWRMVPAPQRGEVTPSG